MKKWLRYLLFGLAGYVVALMATLPAEQAYRWVRPQAAQVGIVLYEVGGSLWEGRAETLTVANKPVGSLSWELSPLAALTGHAKAHWQVQTADGYLEGRVKASADGHATLEDVNGRVPAASLLQYAAYLPVSVSGLVSVRLDRLAVQGGYPIQAKGVVMWHQAALTSPQALKLGDLQLEFAEEMTDGISGRIKDLGGPLEAQGTLALSTDGEYRLQLSLAARPEADEELRQALNLFGRPDPQGKVRVNYSGRL